MSPRLDNGCDFEGAQNRLNNKWNNALKAGTEDSNDNEQGRKKLEEKEISI
jgi:hypothetical protein